MSQSVSLQRDHWLELLKGLDGKVAEVDDWLKQRAKANEKVSRLQTHPGIGLLTSLGLVHTRPWPLLFGPCTGRDTGRLAEFERDILRERVKAGIAQARENGKRHSKPATATGPFFES